MRLHASILLVLSLALTGCPEDPATASAYIIESRDQWVGGPAADAREGDFVVQNDHIKIGVLSERCAGEGLAAICSSPGPGLFGGSLADIDLNRKDSRFGSGQGQDQFMEMFDALNLDVMSTTTVSILADGSDGGPAIVRSEGPSGDYISFMGLLGGLLSLPSTYHVTDYILRPGDPYITVRTHAVIVPNRDTPPAQDPCGWAQGDDGLPCDANLVTNAVTAPSVTETANASGLLFGDFFFAGGDVDLFLPTIGRHEDAAVVEAFESGENSFVHPFDLPYLGASGNGLSYAIGNHAGHLGAPIFSSSLTAVFGAALVPELDDQGEPIPFTIGDVFTYERFVGVGYGDVGSALDALLQASVDRGDLAVGTVTGRVLDESNLQGRSSVEVLVYNASGADLGRDGLPPITDLYTSWRSDSAYGDTIPDGSFGGRLPVGSYLLVAKAEDAAPSAVSNLDVTADATTEVGLMVPQPGTLEFTILDDRGRALPSKISLRPLGETYAPNPDIGDPFIGSDLSKVVYTADGTTRLTVPPGRYQVFVTRGIEYSMWDSDAEGWVGGVAVSAGATTPIEAVLVREVDSTGFIAADLHVHAVPSHDSGVPLTVRALTMAAEGVEFFAATDHDAITDYRPAIEELGLDFWLQSTPGSETTTIEVGHFLGFPLAVDYDQERNGAPDWTNRSPAGMVQDLQGKRAYDDLEPFVFVGHPRDGILGYFDQYGMNPFEGEYLAPVVEPSLLSTFANNANPSPTSALLADPFTFSLAFDGLELFNGKRFDFLRTPTQFEIDCLVAQRDGEVLEGCDSAPTALDLVTRTAAEQTAAETDDTFFFTTELEGQIDDWFTLLNLGYRHTALGNSDTHGTTKVESGCPRNYVVSDVDDPELIDERDVTMAVREHRVVASYGPLIRMSINEAGIGEDISITGSGTLAIEVQAPRWMRVDRVEVYENGRMIREFTGDEMSPNAVVKLDTELAITPEVDAWFVVVALGDDDLGPVFTSVDLPALELNEIVVGALGELELGSIADSLASESPPLPRRHPVYPYAITNPIWVDVDGVDVDLDGSPFDALGHVPEWFRPAPE